MKPFLIFGAGGHAKAVIEAARASNNAPDLIADDDPRASSFLGVPVLAANDIDKLPNGFRFVVAIGNCATRKEKFQWLCDLGGEPETIIHPRACVSSLSQIGAGTVIFPMATIDPCVSIGENSIINIGAVVGHDCRIGNHCHVSANAALGGGAVVEDCAWISLGASVQEGTTIGEGAFIAMGAMISRDVPAHHKAISPHRREAAILPIHV